MGKTKADGKDKSALGNSNNRNQIELAKLNLIAYKGDLINFVNGNEGVHYLSHDVRRMYVCQVSSSHCNNYFVHSSSFLVLHVEWKWHSQSFERIARALLECSMIMIIIDVDFQKRTLQIVAGAHCRFTIQ